MLIGHGYDVLCHRPLGRPASESGFGDVAGRRLNRHSANTELATIEEILESEKPAKGQCQMLRRLIRSEQPAPTSGTS